MRPRLLFLLKYLLFWLGFFVTTKLIFLAWYWRQTIDLPVGATLSILLHGLRMDGAAVAYLSMVPFLLVAISSFVPWRFIRPVVLGWTIFALLIAAALTVGDLELYKEWGFRIDATWVRYLETPAGVGASIADSPLVLLGTMILLISTAGIWSFRRWILPEADAMPQEGILRALLTATCTLFGAALLAIPARGGTQLAPITYSTVYFSPTSDFANQATINVAWSFFNSLYRGDQDDTNPYLVMPDGEARGIRDSLLTRGGPGRTRDLLRIQRPNVILIIWEGFSGKAAASLGGMRGVVPNFDSLSATGVYFDRFYSSGNRTDKGVGAILSGYPALPKTSVLKEPRKYTALPGLGRSFRDAGYVTEFLKGGELEFANIRAFVLTNGFSRLVAKADFPPETWNSKWGAHDQFLLTRVLQDADTTTRPWFLTALTLSSHEPYDFPPPYVYGDTTKLVRYLSSLRYVDGAVGAFIREASTRPWWDSTLVIIVPDHGNRLPSIELTSDAFREETHYIPMLWLGGALKERGIRIHELGTHTDLAPTLLSQLGLPHAGFVWGQDLFAPGRTPFAYYTFSDGFGYLTERGGVMWDNVGQRVLRSYGVTDSLDQHAGAALQQLFVGDFVGR